MVGLSVVLEAQKGGDGISKKTPQVINKTMMLNKHYSPSAVTFNSSHHSPPFQEPTFLDLCFLCRKRLLPEKDIYMYKCKQIFMDEEETIQKENCSLAAMRPTSSASSSASSATRHHQKQSRNRPGGFAY
ncbi:Zf-FLZ domain [Sesbania bispinosa]|nr:Zf-FLZ domain [Sesbania bispinosa]